MIVNTVLMDLPVRVKGYSVENEDCSYSVFINSRLSHEQRLKTYAHELKHISNNDFDMENVQKIEKKAHDDRFE